MLFGRSYKYVSAVIATSLCALKAVNKDNNNNSTDNTFLKFSDKTVNENKIVKCINSAEQTILKYKEESGTPGISVTVSVNGKIIFSEGYGFADVENLTSCTGDTVMRIASISKSFTSVLAGQLIESKALDLDKDISTYLPEFPVKKYEGKKVIITTRQLLSHMSGIRHYTKAEELKKDKKDQIDAKEYFLKEHYSSVFSALALFQDDALCSAPGTEYLYTTHGYTLLSAVLEKCANLSRPEGSKTITFTDMLTKLFHSFQLDSTFTEENNPIIPNRARYYKRKKGGKLENVPYVDNSYKWAGGGLLSSTPDLCHFGHSLVRLYLHGHTQGNLGITKQTLDLLWTPVEATRGNSLFKDGAYALGWCVVSADSSAYPPRPTLVSHTGGAVGATSILLLSIPSPSLNSDSPRQPVVVVAITTNLQNAAGISKTGRRLVKIFTEQYPVN